MNRPQAFRPNRHYTSELRIRTHCPALQRQGNGTDCRIFTLLYQQIVSNWYGTTAGHEFTEEHIQDLLHALGTINQDMASRHQRWLRIHMHTWWTGNWKGTDSVTPPGIHQRQLQQRRNRRRGQEASSPEIQSSDEGTGLPFEYRLAAKQSLHSATC